MWKLLVVSSLIACANTDESSDRGAQTDAEGKADGIVASGTCTGACGGKSTAGSCYCDDDCASFHDCCADAAPVCGVESNRLEDRTAGLAPIATAEVFATLPYPPGNIATSGSRVFISYFPDGNQGNFAIAELVNGAPIAFPSDLGFHADLKTVLGIRADAHGRLWLLDHGLAGLSTPRLIGIDIATQAILVEHRFSPDHAGLGSLLDDLVVSPDGRWIYISDLSPLAKKPAIVVVDLQTLGVQRRLERHASVVNGPYDTFVHDREMRFKGLRATQGVDGIALSQDGATLFYAALNGGELWQVSTQALRSGTPTPTKIADITQTDGMIGDAQGRIYLTDMERSQVVRVGGNGLEVVARDPKLRWPDGFAWHADGSLLVTASSLHTFMPKLIVTSSHIASNAPYHVLRVRL